MNYTVSAGKAGKCCCLLALFVCCPRRKVRVVCVPSASVTHSLTILQFYLAVLCLSVLTGLLVTAGDIVLKS